MAKMTQAQRKQMARIRAWLDKEPFRENLRDKFTPRKTPYRVADFCAGIGGPIQLPLFTSP